MIRTYTGKPRAGKSYGAVKNEAYVEATEGIRTIVTNLSLDPGELSALVQERCPGADFDPNVRLVLITKEEAKQFWLIRGPAPEDRLNATTIEEQKAGIFPDFGVHQAQRNNPGVLYILDEAHVLFDARMWASNGLALTYYNSQHGKLNDDVVFITQFIGLLDKRCVGFSQSFHVFRNYRFEKFMTIFRAPGHFEETVYSVMPAKGVEWDERHTYKIDSRLAACYDTSAGVGISGRKQPEKPRIKGLSFKWLVAGVAAASISLWWISDLPGWLFLKSSGGQAVAKTFVGSHGQAAIAPSLNKEEHQVNAGINSPSEKIRSPKRVIETVQDSPIEETKLWVRGYAVGRGQLNVLLSDGRVLSEGDGILARIERNYIELRDGRRIYRQPSAGSGARVAPVRSDTEVPTVALPVSPIGSRSGGLRSAGQDSLSEPVTPPPQQQGSWVVGSDGVQRLRERPSFSGTNQ